MKKKLITLIAGLACAVSAYAVPAAPGLKTITQPDGTTVTVKLVGDEFLHFTTTADGYTVERNDEGYFVYVQKVDGEISRTSVVAHDAANRSAQELQLIESLPKNIVADKAVADAEASRSEARALIKGKSVSATPKGAEYDYSNFRGLVILAEFTDRKFSRTNANEIFSDLVSKKDFKGVPKADNPEEVEPYTGSVRDYFYDNSMGKFDPEFDVAGPFEINYTSTSMLNNGSISSTAISAVIAAADGTVDFSQYDRDGDGVVDMFYIIFAGFGSNYTGNNEGYMWPHQGYQYKRVDGVYTYKYACSTEFYGYESTGDYGIDGIGTIAHEFSHVLGLVDEYDTDYNGSGGQSFHPDAWSVMSGGSYYNNSRTPVAYSALQRTQAGFSLPTVIEKEGDYSLNITAETNEYYRINSPVDKEYFLLENRNRKSKWDEFLPGDGMLIFHVDSTKTTPWRNNTVNCNPAHNYYQLLRAKPSSFGYSTDGDPFPGSGNVTRINNTTSPNLVTWTGEKTELVLSNISIDGDGIVSFSASKDYFGSVTEDFEAMPTEGDFSNVPGTYATWSFKNCAPGVWGSTRGNGDQSVKMAAQGEVVINNVNAQLIEGIELAVWNKAVKDQTLTVSVSTDDGATWTEIFQRGTTATTIVDKGSTGVRYYLEANVPDKAMFKIVASGTLYIDDVSICYVDPNGLSDVEDIKIADKAQLNVLPATDGIIVGSDSNEAVEVFNAEGQLVARGTANATIALPARGFYIVRQGSATRKFIF